VNDETEGPDSTIEPDDRDTNQIVVSEAPDKQTTEAVQLGEVLHRMGEAYRRDPVQAVRGQTFISLLHEYVATQLESRLTTFAIRRGIKVRLEPLILGSTKPKNVDVAVVDPDNGPLILIGLRSQMSSIGKNVLTYYEGIVGECVSLQERFPMAVHGYAYLHPYRSIMPGHEEVSIDHLRYARMYAAVTGRPGPGYKGLRGVFDEFAYMVVDFGRNPPDVMDEHIKTAVPEPDMSIHTFVNRLITLFKSRLVFWDVFD